MVALVIGPSMVIISQLANSGSQKKKICFWVSFIRPSINRLISDESYNAFEWVGQF